MASDSIRKLKEMLERNCVIEKIQPAVFASDAEVNIVIVTVRCHDGKSEVIKAYRDEAHELREFIRILQNK